MTEHRKYLCWFAGMALGVILLLGGLNLLVDPYDRFGLNRLGVYISAEREFKDTEFDRFAPEAVLFGNSRAALIDVSGLGGYRFFNAAFGGAEIEEIESFIQHHVKNQKLVVLALDVFNFGPRAQPATDTFKPLTLRRSLDYILNLQNVEYSVRTIFSHLNGKRRDLAPDGTFAEANWATKVDHADDETARRKVRELRDELAVYKFDPARLQPLRDIQAILQQRGIELRVYLPPIHAGVLAGLQGTSGLGEMQITGDAIKAICPQTVDLTAGEYSAAEDFFRGDPLHFRSGLGRKLLAEKVLPAN